MSRFKHCVVIFSNTSSSVPAAIGDDDLNGIFGIELDSLDGDIEVPAIPKKRKPGRPKKVTAVKTTAKRKPGRPKKAEKAAVTAMPEKRKPGRPKKTETAASKKIASATGKKSTVKITRKISKKNTAGKKS